jgi:hypothetical protein
VPGDVFLTKRFVMKRFGEVPRDDGGRIGQGLRQGETMIQSLLEIDCAPMKPGSGKIEFE